MMTLRQVKSSAPSWCGTIGGAAKLSASRRGISRLVKYTEKSLGIKFFSAKVAIFRPEAQSIFEQINGVYKRSRPHRIISRSDAARCRNCAWFGASILGHGAPRHRAECRRYPELRIDINILKIGRPSIICCSAAANASP